MSSVTAAPRATAVSGLVVHAERLERDDVWARTVALLDAVERRGGIATCFVHPYSAIQAGMNLAPRIRELIDRGHEVGQHTHFYGEAVGGGKPTSDLSDDNVRRCLDRDLSYLREAGGDPHGFTAGAWVEHPAAGSWLRSSRFDFDCTGRSFALRRSAPGVDAIGRRTTAALVDGLVDLPTTASVADAARGLVGRQPARLPLGPGVRYELVYIHDYDLLAWRYRAAVRAVLISRRTTWRTAGSLAASARGPA
jgi:hypothetical protein